MMAGELPSTFPQSIDLTQKRLRGGKTVCSYRIRRTSMYELGNDTTRLNTVHGISSPKPRFLLQVHNHSDCQAA